ncbi:glycosyltransferase family 117 protein [Flavobacterium sp.]|uniref:glycosyltransferase family 117 protein n=1 Tax=Flavobacterium sp. TaxID=239 RepID=UPI002FDEC051
MMNFNFNKWNTVLGWTTFAIALITYTLTVEPTMSFWDCGEYISTAAKLEVGHPPGAPLYQLLGAFFAMFAFGKENIALMVNMMSVFSSAFTILFMFWSSTILLRKIVSTYTELDKNKAIVILGSSFVGSLAFTFSDSFWASAVEAEVYAMASLFIALLFWLALRWEEDMHKPKGNRWLLLISLLIGLSFGVHFMALLTIPSIGFLYFFKNFQKVTVKNFIIANIIIVAILLFIFKLLLPYTLAFFGKMEIFMVNSIGLPFNSGTIIAALLIVAFFYFGLKYTREKGHPFYNTALLCILFVLIGFSTWMMLPIRANANVVINENKPSDAAEVLAYYNREQYGVNPLFYGPQYTDTFAGLDEEQPYLDKAPNYERDYKTGKYVIVNNYKNAEQNTADDHKAFLPRLWSTDHIENYIEFTGVPKFRLNPNYDYAEELPQYVDVDTLNEEQMAQAAEQLRELMQKNVADFKTAYAQKQVDKEDYINFLKKYSDYIIVEKPSAWDNLSFMVEYQFGYMYGRYLLWNFVGRQNDIQGKYDNLDGNWISGIKFIDEIHLGKGSQTNLPDDVKNNKGRNVYYFIPFIIGLIGLMYHAQRDLKSFYVLLALFLFTSIALKIFLNERPFEPRERDYALVGSFYVFAIWIGFGVYALYEIVCDYIKSKIIGPVVVGLCLLGVPVLMASQNWDDHDRSNRYTAPAMAINYLNSCDKNAILFTIGDNDTFPLWYAQEIEGVRPDVKIINTQLFMTDWNIDQAKFKTYEAEGLPISFEHHEYVGDKLDYVAHIPKTDARWEIKSFIDFIKNPKSIFDLPNGQTIHFYPTNKIRIPVDKNAIIKNKVVAPKYYDSIVPYIDLDIKGSAMYKNRLMMLDVIANNNWERPIYFTGGSFGDDDYLWMKDYLKLDGLVYKLVPIKTPVDKENPYDMGQIDSEKMYHQVMNWTWGNGELTTIYHDPETRKNSISYRTNMARLMELLINENKIDKAKKVIELGITKMPMDYYGYYTMLEPFAGGYYAVGEKAKARELLEKLMTKYKQNLTYYAGIQPSIQNGIATDIITDIERYRSLLIVMKDRGDLEFYNKNKPVFNSYVKRFARFGRDLE